MAENLLRHCSPQQSITIETRTYYFTASSNGMMHYSKAAEKKYDIPIIRNNKD